MFRPLNKSTCIIFIFTLLIFSGCGSASGNNTSKTIPNEPKKNHQSTQTENINTVVVDNFQATKDIYSAAIPENYSEIMSEANNAFGSFTTGASTASNKISQKISIDSAIEKLELKSGKVEKSEIAGFFSDLRPRPVSKIVGTVKGSLSINQGVANYTIPLDLPHGVANLKPELSLNYNSDSDNGVVGIGWSLNGISTISRCSQTKASDGNNYKSGIKYVSSDRFCLDGQRLIKTGSGPDYDIGSGYKTEINNYSKITSHGYMGPTGSPKWFEVKGKNGLTYTYGKDNATIVKSVVGSNTKVFWKIKSIKDANENSIVFNYKRDDFLGSNYIDNIQYAGNEIKFTYGSRPDTIKGYLAGKLFTTDKRLTRISTRSHGITVNEYVLSYKNENEGSHRSFVKSIDRYASGKKLKPLYLYYKNNTLRFTTKDIPFSTPKDAHYIDFNGDGCLDIFDKFKVAIGSCNGSFSAFGSIGYRITNVENSEIVFSDFNGDGKVEALVKGSNGSLWYLHGKNLKNTIRKEGYQEITKNFDTMKLADFDNDGLMDIYSNGIIYLNQDNGNFIYSKKLDFLVDNRNIFVVDLDNNMLPDFLAVSNNKIYSMVNTSYGSLNFMAYAITNIQAKASDLKLADLNKDGSIDIYEVDSGDDNLWINDGYGKFHQSKNHPNILADASDIKIADLNNDGYLDIYEVDGGADNIWLNNGQENFIKIPLEPNIHNDQSNLIFSDFNGDGTVDILETNKNKLWMNTSSIPLLSNIYNYVDEYLYIQYANMTDKRYYLNFSQIGRKYGFNNISNDNIEITTTKPIVKSISNILTNSQNNYSYYGYIYNKLRGLQGFHIIREYDSYTKTATTTHYRQIEKPHGEGFQFTGLPFYSETNLVDGNRITKYTSTSMFTKDISQIKKIYEPYVHTSIQKIFDPDTRSHIKSIYKYNKLSNDGLGNTLGIVERTSDLLDNINFDKTTIKKYEDEDTDSWQIGKPTKITTIFSKSNDQSSVVRSSIFHYNSQGLISSETANINTPLSLNKKYTYDHFGNKASETISGTGIETSKSTFGYSNDGRRRVVTTNTLGLSERKTYDTRFDYAASITGPNGITTHWDYDALGRKISERRADGTSTTWTYAWTDYNSGFSSTYNVKKTETGKPTETVYFDAQNREVAIVTNMFNKTIIKKKEYNNKGELVKETLPYFSNTGEQSAGSIITEYDAFSREIKVTKTGPNNHAQIYSTTYDNFSQTITDPLGHKKRIIKNAAGETIKIVDAYHTSAASLISYKYDAIGNLIETTDAANNKIISHYDYVGNKIYMNDPDLGERENRYNAIGKLIYTKNSKGQIKQIRYNNSGQILEERNTEGSKSIISTTYNYGASDAEKGSIGKLISSKNYSTMYGQNKHSQDIKIKYDTLGRQYKFQTTIDSQKEYVTQMDFCQDSGSGCALGEVRNIVYPNGYKITNYYKNGLMDKVMGSDGKTHYQIDDISAFGNISKATYGNGVKSLYTYDRAGFTGNIISYTTSPVVGNVQRVSYQYDLLGNVLSRADTSIDSKYINDTFSYDAMNRLSTVNTASDIIGAYSKSNSYLYDKLGNITYQADIGHYSYYKDKPHAVKTAGNKSYTYDKIGNMLRRDGESITYNAISKPAIMKNKAGKEIKFFYGSDQARYIKQTSNLTTYYIDKSYEEQIDNEGYTKEILYITIGGNIVGTHTETKSPYKKLKNIYNNYFHKDALGSITAITDDNAKVIERRSYTPFGKIRAMDYKTNNNALSNHIIHSAKAYTGHEQIEELSGLIHMNARVYDSDIGRFLSADTIVQDATDSQAYNRYSYARNNPMMFTDPSGHSWFSRLWKKIKNNWKAIVTVIVAIVVMIAAPQLIPALAGGGFWSTVGVGALSGFAAGFTGAKLYGAGTKDAFIIGLKGAAAGALTASIGAHYGNEWSMERIAMHGLSGGANSELMGGNFMEGFKMSAALAATTWGALKMREYEIKSSSKYSYIVEEEDGTRRTIYPNLHGSSSGGIGGDNLKTAGGRATYGQLLEDVEVAPLGGVQGGQGKVFGISYRSGGFVDYVVESFGGPHDYWRDLSGMYDRYGCSVTSNNMLFKAWDQVDNFAGVFAVAPIVGASILQKHDYVVSIHRKYN